MTQTVTALFDTRPQAMAAIEKLTEAGIPRTSIRIMPETDSPATTTTNHTAYDRSRDEKGFWASLGDFFMPDEDRYSYSEAMHRGSIVVSVSGEDVMVDRAEDILEQHGTVNLDEREAAWKKEGWAGYNAPTAAAGMTPTAASGTASKSTGLAAHGAGDDVGTERLQEVEERLKVGKRQVSSGRVKVRSYVVETPVSEQVNLRSETVHVERRPVDRAIPVGEDAFRDRTIEATATSEEAVVSKEARVTGEVLLRKDVEQHSETITDKVRSTKVEVEDERAGGAARRDERPPR